MQDESEISRVLSCFETYMTWALLDSAGYLDHFINMQTTIFKSFVISGDFLHESF